MGICLVQFYCERLDFLRIIDKYRFKFYNKLYRYSNYVVRQCLLNAEQNLEFRRLYFSYDVCVGDFVPSFCIYLRFYDICCCVLRSVCLSVSLYSCYSSTFVVNKRQYIGQSYHRFQDMF